MTPRSHPPKSLKLLAAAVAAASIVSCSSGGSEPRADTKSSPGAVSGDQATDATSAEDATATTADDATDTTADDATSDSTTTTDPGPDPGEEPEVLGSSSGAHPADPNDATSVPLRVDVVGVQRQPGDAVEVRFVITNDSADATFQPYSTLSDAGGRYDVGGAALVDLTGDKRYLPLRDSEGVCLCTGVNNVEIAPGMSLDVYVQFPAPPDDVTTIDFTFPGFAPVNGVEIR